MLEIELADLLHTAGPYLLTTLIVIIVWTVSDLCTRHHLSATLLDRASSASQSRIRHLERQLKEKNKTITALQDQLSEHRTLHLAVEQTLYRAIKISREDTPYEQERD